MAFSIESINLTSMDPETGLNNTAAVYRVDNIDRQLSIGELVMVICLARAVEMEEEVTKIMSSMNSTTWRLEQLATLEDKLMEKRQSESQIKTRFSEIGLNPADFDGQEYWDTWLRNEPFNLSLPSATEVKGSSGDSYWYLTPDQIDTTITAMETKMDELNTFSQQSMIQLQSATNKRDQAYDLCSALLKSFSTVLIGTANNL